MASPKLKLYYFDLPGRAETTRILFNVGNVAFEDFIVPRTEWPALKPTMPFGQVPVLEVDGKMLAQSGAIERYAAKLAKLYPEDIWEAAKVEELINYTQEIGDLIRPTYSIQDPAAKLKARQELMAGPAKAKMDKLAEQLQAGGGEYFVGGKLTYADIMIYSVLSNLISGFLDGIGPDVLDAHPALKAHHNRVASVPAIATAYENATGFRATYKPLA